MSDSNDEDFKTISSHLLLMSEAAVRKLKRPKAISKKTTASCKFTNHWSCPCPFVDKSMNYG